jgi:hypothetical protein
MITIVVKTGEADAVSAFLQDQAGAVKAKYRDLLPHRQRHLSPGTDPEVDLTLTLADTRVRSLSYRLPADVDRGTATRTIEAVLAGYYQTGVFWK